MMLKSELCYCLGRVKDRKRKDEDDVEEYVEGKLSRSIMQQARLQVQT